MRNFIFFLFTFFFTSFLGFGQEMNFTVKVNTQKLQTVDPKIFTTLENTLTEFLNSQKWTDDAFEIEERIEGNLLLTIQEELSPTSFKANIAIQASRPIFGTDQNSLMINHIDNDITFNYQEYDPIRYSRNNFIDNLSSILAFYVNIILGLDYDSFAPFGGERYYQTAQEIVNTIPQSVVDSDLGWNSSRSDRNRFWIIENILSPRVRPYRQAIYDYHRQALDIMSDDVATGRAIMLQALTNIRDVNQAYPNAIITRMFVNAKADEIIEIYKNGTKQEQDEVIRIMTKIDASGAAKYRSIR